MNKNEYIAAITKMLQDSNDLDLIELLYQIALKGT